MIKYFFSFMSFFVVHRSRRKEKAQGHWLVGCDFTLYGDEDHLGHVTRSI